MQANAVVRADTQGVKAGDQLADVGDGLRVGDRPRGVCCIHEDWLVGGVDWVVEDEGKNVSSWYDRRWSHREEAHIWCSVPRFMLEI